MKLEVKILLTPEDIAEQISQDIASLLNYNAANNKETFISLSGGNTPKILFRKMSGDFRDKIRWDKLHLFWGDERCVPPDDEESNYGMAREYLLNNIDIPEKNIHRIRGEEDPDKEAARIAAEINSIVPEADGLASFDLNILGLGEDGHTASLFPGKKLKNIAERTAGVAVHPKTSQKRISLTLEVINNSKQNMFMVTGENKADIIYEIMSRKDAGKRYPAGKVRAAEIIKWYIDEEAAGDFKKKV